MGPSALDHLRKSNFLFAQGNQNDQVHKDLCTGIINTKFRIQLQLYVIYLIKSTGSAYFFAQQKGRKIKLLLSLNSFSRSRKQTLRNLSVMLHNLILRHQ